MVVIRWGLLVFLMAAALPGAIAPEATDAQAANAVTANGCTITPRKPGLDLGQVWGYATIECPTALAGRALVVEVWHRSGAGDWILVPESQTYWEGADAELDARGAEAAGIDCPQVEAGHERRFKTRIAVSDGAGSFAEAFSDVRKLQRNCLGINDGPDEVGSGGVTAEGIRHVAVGPCDADIHHPWIYSSDILTRAIFECENHSTHERRLFVQLLQKMANVNQFKIWGGVGTWASQPVIDLSITAYCTGSRQGVDHPLIYRARPRGPVQSCRLRPSGLRREWP